MNINIYSQLMLSVSLKPFIIFMDFLMIYSNAALKYNRDEHSFIWDHW